MAADPEGLHPGQAPHGGEGPQGGDDIQVVSQRQVEVAGHLVADGDAGRVIFAAFRQIGKLPLQHLQGLGPAPADDLQVQTPDHPAGDVPGGRIHHLGVNKGGGGNHPGQRLDLGHFLLGGGEGAPRFHDQDVGVDAEDLLFQVLVEAGHHPDDHDEGHDPDGNPGRGDEGGKRQEAFLAFDSPQEPQGHEGFKETQGTYLSGLSNGNRMTSRMEGESVRSITRRSMPMPSPAVGGRPCSRAWT